MSSIPIARFKAGDRSALDQIYREFQLPLNNRCQRTLKDAAEAEDVVEETFLRAWKSKGSCPDEDGKFVGWLFCIARNLCTDILRRRRNQVSLNDEDDFLLSKPADPAPTLEEAALRPDIEPPQTTLKEVMAALKRLAALKRATPHWNESDFYIIARNVCIAWLRTYYDRLGLNDEDYRRSSEPADPAPAPEQVAPRTDDEMDQATIKAVLAAARSHWDRLDYNIFILHCLEELSYEDIALIFGKRPGTLRSRFHSRIKPVLDRVTEEGRKNEFIEIYRRYEPRVTVVCLHFLSDVRAAEEATVETFVRVWRELRELGSQTRDSAWLSRIVRSVCSDIARAHQQQTDPAPRQENAVAGPDELINEREAVLAKAKSRWERLDYLTLLLHICEKRPLGETAQLLDVPTAMVRSCVHNHILPVLREVRQERRDWGISAA